jgi:hypothetical protein
MHPCTPSVDAAQCGGGFAAGPENKVLRFIASDANTQSILAHTKKRLDGLCVCITPHAKPASKASEELSMQLMAMRSCESATNIHL